MTLPRAQTCTRKSLQIPKGRSYRLGSGRALHFEHHGRGRYSAPPCPDRQRETRAARAAGPGRGRAGPRSDRTRDLRQGGRRGDGQELQSAIDITLQRFAEYHSLQVSGAVEAAAVAATRELAVAA